MSALASIQNQALVGPSAVGYDGPTYATNPASTTGYYTVATLPDPTLTPFQYARITDLFGSVQDVVISSATNGVWVWKPVRPFATATLTASQDYTLGVLTHPPTIILNGLLNIGTTRNLSFSATNAFDGAKFRIRRMTTGTGGVVNIMASLTAVLGVTTWMDVEYISGIGWTQTGSGGIL